MTYQWSTASSLSVSDQINFAVSGFQCNFDVMLRNNNDEQYDPAAWATFCGEFKDALETAGFTVSTPVTAQSQTLELDETP